jgi:hypothetical protein
MNKLSKHPVTFGQLIEAAQLENWDFVNRHLNGEHLSKDRVVWVFIEGLSHRDQNVRDLAVSILDESDVPLSDSEIQIIEHVMRTDSYDIVQFRAAMALFKRNHRTNEVMQMMAEAAANPDVGELALILLHGK